MTTPVAPAKFTHPDDVKARDFERKIPDELYLLTPTSGWVQERIVDVESQLLGLVGSLEAPLSQIDERRQRAVRALVSDKVIDLYTNPRGASSVKSDMDGFSETQQLRGSNTSQRIWFSPQELDSVRTRKKRPRFGTIPVGAGPWGPSRC